MGGLGGAAPQPDFFEIIGQNLNNKSGWRQEGKQKTLGGGVWGAHPLAGKFVRFGLLRPEASKRYPVALGGNKSFRRSRRFF